MKNIATTMKRNYGITRSDFLSGRISDEEQRDLLTNVLKEISGGRLLFPDSLYDGAAKKRYRAGAKSAYKKLEKLAEDHDQQLFKYLIPDLPYTARDNVWSQNTIRKAKSADSTFFRVLGHEFAPRIAKLERQACVVGGFHGQGIVMLPKGTYSEENFLPLVGGTFDYGVYLAKLSEQALERDHENKLVYGNLPLALESVRTWYVQTLKNQQAGIKRNPSASWRVGIPNEKRGKL